MQPPERPSDDIQTLTASLTELHASVHRLIQVCQDSAQYIVNSQEMLDKLPLLDFYNDDLQRNIEILTRLSGPALFVRFIKSAL
jgi:hypothetical protein